MIIKEKSFRIISIRKLIFPLILHLLSDQQLSCNQSAQALRFYNDEEMDLSEYWDSSDQDAVDNQNIELSNQSIIKYDTVP